MDPELYSLIAMAARYWFAALMLIIVFRAWRITTTDSRRARVVRELAPETGAIGQLLVLKGTRKKKRASLPILKEGTIGSSFRNDVCLRAPGVRRFHAYMEERQGAVLVKLEKHAQAALNGEATGSVFLLHSGDRLQFGNVLMEAVLFDPDVTDPKKTKKADTPFTDENIWADRDKARPSFFEETESGTARSKKTSVRKSERIRKRK